ncbi:MAG: DUF3299 domain-containing protein [Deltaproteobacteria bacterium]|jgi:hypothetical protein|nr:DUF3299 domain-containing protein [Deltaproteobacteria bacterium]
MRRTIILFALILLVTLPLVIQPAPFVPRGSEDIKGRLFVPSSVQAQARSEARLLNDTDNPHQPKSDPVEFKEGEKEPDSYETETVSRPKASLDPAGYLQNGWLIWEELMPVGWDPAAIFDELKINDMADDDPKVDQVIEEFLKRWNNSPTNAEIDSKLIKIPGFVVPLDFEAEKVDEFFLVPFFGACIHVPPPPPNQIIMVRMKKPINGLGVMEVVWVYGKIRQEKVTTDIGNSGYSLTADKVEFYQMDEDQS